MSPELQIQRMIEMLHNAKNDGFDPAWDCQVVVAVNDKSPLSRKKINQVLQEHLNPNDRPQGSPFAVADKIVNLKNGYFPVYDDGTLKTRPEIPKWLPREDDYIVDADNEYDAEILSDRAYSKAIEDAIGKSQARRKEYETWKESLSNGDSFSDDKEAFVANGELAEVLAVEPKRIIARLSNPYRVISIPRGKASESSGDESSESGDAKTNTGCSWDLGYGLSVHKSQGSEWPVVLVLIDDYPSARMVCNREWIYTAISRAKERCVLIGKKSTADRFCKRKAIGDRKTFLRELICKGLAERELEGI